jgi:hypothetical protein
MFRLGCRFYLSAEPPADCTHNVPLSSQSKVLMLKQGNGVKNERKMTGNLPRSKRRRRRIRNKNEKMLAQKSVKSKFVLLVGWLMVQLKGR